MGNKTTAISTYNTTVPEMAPIDLFVFNGNSMADGYSSTWLSMYEQTKYCPEGDVSGIYRSHNGSSFVLLNRDNNPGAALHNFGNEVCCSIDVRDSEVFLDPIYVFNFYVNGIYLIMGDAAVTFSSFEIGGYWNSLISQLYHKIRLFKFNGQKPTIRLFNHADWTNEAINHSVQDYIDNITDMVAKFRSIHSNYGGNDIPVVWGKICNMSQPGNDQGLRYQQGVEAVELTDSKFFGFDFFVNFPFANDGYHPRTHCVRNFGKYCASIAIHNKTGNALPVASAVTVSGTLRQGFAITASYTYSDADGDLEGATEIEVISSVYDHDTVNSDVIYHGIHVKGESYTLNSSHLNRYIKVRVIPVALTGAPTGKAVLSSTWIGPVTI
jgi:hypothetical protein